jgi:mono/diheme cytochrome c family protein
MKPWTMVLLALAGCGDKGDDSGGGDDGGGDLVGDPVEGAEIFALTCARSDCHGPDGSGSGSEVAADLAVEVPTKTDAEIMDIIQNGYKSMAPQGLNDQEATDVIAYLRQEFPG